ncbi:polymer-forming cytoskeletal protein [Myxococcota bacterium]|nr:polymer-forming cytoskeletal protein [Myxococcota bacterium]
MVAAVAAADSVADAGVGSDRSRGARHPDIVDRVFGPGAGQAPRSAGPAADAEIPPLAGIQPLYPDLDVDFSIDRIARKRSCILGPASKVAGDLVADENVEVQGLVEGCVRARRSRVTVCSEGLVQSRIEARSVRVRGTIRGNVTAEDWVEVKAGGVIRGDVCAPRIILHDGAIVTGRLDMSGALASRRTSERFDPLVVPPRPRMRKVPRER